MDYSEQLIDELVSKFGLDKHTASELVELNLDARFHVMKRTPVDVLAGHLYHEYVQKRDKEKMADYKRPEFSAEYELSVDGKRYRAVQESDENRYIQRYDQASDSWVRDDFFPIGDWVMFRQIVGRIRKRESLLIHES